MPHRGTLHLVFPVIERSQQQNLILKSEFQLPLPKDAGLTNDLTVLGCTVPAAKELGNACQ